MDLQLKNKKALVLASSKGIGRGVAAALAQEGCHVLIAASDKARIEEAQKQIKEQTGAKVDAYTVDLYSAESTAKFADQILKDHGRIDILVTNAPGPSVTDAAAIPADLLAKAMQANFFSVLTLCQKFIPGMIQGKFGRIINLASTTAKEPDNGMVLSNMTRAAVLAYCKTLSREIASNGITVNSILTGGVMTERTINLRKARSEKTGISFEELTANASKSFPVGFIPTPEQFAPMITFLASPLAADVNGVGLPIDGGYMRGM